jgi:hypothetical protein
MDLRLNSRQVWFSALIFGALAPLLAVPLVLVLPASALRGAALPVAVASALFWGTVAVVAVYRFWELYYQYLYPAWMRWLAPLDVLLYGAIGLAIWWLAVRLPGPAVLWFVLLGGIEGIAEHVLGIYGLRILEKVPWLNGVKPAPVLAFSFVEYMVYWALVGWLAFGLNRLLF